MTSAPVASASPVTSGLRQLVDVAAAFHLYGVVDGALVLLGSPSVDALTDLLTARVTRTYNGMSITIPEAADIVRGNEAVRGDVIARVCGPDARCGGTVVAAAGRLLQDVDRDTAAQLDAVAGWLSPSSVPSAPFVIVTGGLPYRERPTAAIDRAVARLNAVPGAIFIVRLSGARGFLRDAWDDVLPHGRDVHTIDLSNDRDVQTLASGMTAAAAAAPDTAALPAPRSTQEPAAPILPAPTPLAVDAELLGRLATFVAEFERTFAAVVWHEVYTQEDHVAARFGSSGTVFNTLRQRRRLESELLFVWIPADATWIAVRDVVSVDGKPRPADERRLPALLAAGPVTLRQLRTLAEENGRFNIGAVLRTFNEPTLALLFADDRYRSRFRFSRASMSEVDGTAAATINFVEVRSPTVIRDGVRDLPASGQLVVDPSSGRVLRTRLQIADDRAGIRGTVAVTYRFDRSLATMVPADMRESYQGPSREVIDCTAVYSDFRRFQTSGRIIVPQ